MSLFFRADQLSALLTLFESIALRATARIQPCSESGGSLTVARKTVFLAVILCIIAVGAIAVSFAVLTHQAPPNLGSNQPYPFPSGKTPPPSTAPTSSSTTTPTPSATARPIASPSSPCPTPTLPPANSTVNGLLLSISLEKNVFEVGEPVNVTLTITNVSSETVDFTVTAMNFDFLVYNSSNGLVYQWSYLRVFPQYAYIDHLTPGKTLTSTEIWPQTANIPTSGIENQQVPAGTFYVIGESPGGFVTAPTQITILNP